MHQDQEDAEADLGRGEVALQGGHGGQGGHQGGQGGRHGTLGTPGHHPRIRTCKLVDKQDPRAGLSTY